MKASKNKASENSKLFLKVLECFRKLFKFPIDFFEFEWVYLPCLVVWPAESNLKIKKKVPESCERLQKAWNDSKIFKNVLKGSTRFFKVLDDVIITESRNTNRKRLKLIKNLPSKATIKYQCLIENSIDLSLISVYFNMM
jgi:hypothetical protein